MIMASLKSMPAVLALVALAALYTAPARAAQPDMTPVPPQGVRIVLPSGEVIVIPVEPTTPMPGGKNQDHMVGEDLC